MSLSLIADYGSSSESEDEDNNIQLENKVEINIKKSLQNNIKNEDTININKINSSTKKNNTTEINNNKNNNNIITQKKGGLSSFLPPPKNKNINNNDNNSNGVSSLFSKLPVPQKKKQVEKRKILLDLMEPISNIDDAEAEEIKRELEEERKNKFKKQKVELPANENNENKSKGGLFALLPAPKKTSSGNDNLGSATKKSIKMIPYSLKKRNEMKEKEKAKKDEKEKEDNLKKELSEENDEVVTDFFSIDTEDKKINEENNEKDTTKELNITNNSINKVNSNPDMNYLNGQNSSEYASSSINAYPANDNQYHQNPENTYSYNQYQYPQDPNSYNYDYTQQYYPQPANMDNNFLKLHEMGEFPTTEIKEINQKDQILETYEIERIKQTTVNQPLSTNFKGIGKDYKPSYKQKSKHNIMYLAYQAKAKEQEVAESLYQRKANRKASGKKYGF